MEETTKSSVANTAAAVAVDDNVAVVNDATPADITAPDFLSPVSKLQQARELAAQEQQKRVDQACKEIVERQKAKILKRKELEDRLEKHVEKKYKKLLPPKNESLAAAPVPVAVTEEKTVATSLLDNFDAEASEEDEENKHPNTIHVVSMYNHSNYDRQKQLQEQDRSTEKSLTSHAPYTVNLSTNSKLSALETVEGDDITRELLRQTRNKLDRIMANQQKSSASPLSSTSSLATTVRSSEPDWDGRPLTAFHLKQMELVKDKVNIYAPLRDQEQQIQQALTSTKPVQRPVPSVLASHQQIAAKKYGNASDDDEDDSDYFPSEGSSVESDSTALSDESASCTETESDSSLLLCEREMAPVKRRMQLPGHLSADSWFFWIPVYVLSICVLVLALLLAVDIAETRYHFCQLKNVTSNTTSQESSCQFLLHSKTILQRLSESLATPWRHPNPHD